MPQNRNTEYLKKLLGKKNKSKELHFVARKLIVQQTWRGKLWKCSFRVVQFRGDCATLKFVNPPDFDLLCALCTSSVVWDASVCLWSSLGGPRRCSQVAGSQTWLDLLLDIFPHHGGVLVKASWRTQKCWGEAYLASTWLPTILEWIAMLMSAELGMHVHTHPRACRGTFLPSGNSQAHSSIARSSSHSETVTHSNLWIHQQPFTAEIHVKYLCLHSHSFPPTHGFMSGYSPVEL